MKKMIAIATLLLSVQAAATCVDHFENGIAEYNFAQRYFNSGMTSYNEAVEMSRSSNPNFLAICNKLVDSVSGFTVAKNSYGACAGFFNQAVSSCSGQDSQVAAENAGVCNNNFGIANDNQATMLGLLKNTCYKGSGAVELKTELNSTLMSL